MLQENLNQAYKEMKRRDIKKRPMADTTLASLEPEASVYRELDSRGLYWRVKPNGQKSWELGHKKPDGNGRPTHTQALLGSFADISRCLNREQARSLRGPSRSSDAGQLHPRHQP